MIVVLPPASAEREPVSQVSPVGELSCSMWTWESTPLEVLLDIGLSQMPEAKQGTHPGVMYAPSASTMMVSGPTSRPQPSSAILPSLIPISIPRGRTSVAVTSFLISRYKLWRRSRTLDSQCARF